MESFKQNIKVSNENESIVRSHNCIFEPMIQWLHQHQNESFSNDISTIGPNRMMQGIHFIIIYFLK